MLKLSPLAEWVSRKVLISTSRPERIWWKAWRRLLKAFGNPPVQHYPIGRYVLLLPLSHPLPSYQRALPLYDTSLPRLAKFVADRLGRPPVVLDIGANVGDTSLGLAAASDCRIIAVEGNPLFLPFLEANLKQLGGAAVIAPVFAGSGEAENLAVETRHGTAKLVRVSVRAAERLEFQSIETIVSRAGFGPPDIIKSDTDGFDIRILREALPYIAQHKPALHFEFDPSVTDLPATECWAFLSELREIGYSEILVYRNTGVLVGPLAPGDPIAINTLAAEIDFRQVHYFDMIAIAQDDRRRDFHALEAVAAQS